MVAACATEAWDEDELFEMVRRAWPYRDLTRDQFDQVIDLHTPGRYGLLHRDGVNRRLMGRRRARITSVTCGGAIPDTAQYHVVEEPEGLFVGTLDEDFAIECNAGDIFQLGNTSWRVLRVETGTVRVADAQGQPPTIPFWFGESPARTAEVCAEVSKLREECTGADWLQRETGIPELAAIQLSEYFKEGTQSLGAVPSQTRVILERFFDESGGMQLILHAPFGRRINRAWGLALRKRFCRGFGFELQAAANEEAIVISLGTMHSFPLADVLDYLHPESAQHLLIQAMLPTPMFSARWRWNIARSLLLERMRNGQKVPPAIMRMRANDLLAAAFPGALACPETMEGPDIPVPMEHPLVRQTIEDCLTEAMDVEGFLEVLRGLEDGRIERLAVDTPAPSAFARGILSVQPHSFLDDAPLEERRTQAVMSRRALDPRDADDLGALDPDAVRRVREEAWPQPQSLEEVHEALLWMGYVTADEGAASSWQPWIGELAAAGRIERDGDRWFAVEASRDPKEVWRGRLAALGPIFADNEAALLELEHEGAVLRARLDGKQAWCDRRLLARIHRYTLQRLRREIEPVSTAVFLRFLRCWQHVDGEHRLEGPRGVAEVVRQMAGFAMPAAAWEKPVLTARISDYRREWLDELTLSGEVVWGRLWGAGASAIRSTPICLVLRADLDAWLALSPPVTDRALSGSAHEIREVLQRRGAMFPQELERAVDLPPLFIERGLSELVSHGLVTCDSFAALRQLLRAPSKRRWPTRPVGRWSLFRSSGSESAPDAEFAARQLLKRTGVVFRRTVLRERMPVTWSELVRVYRRLELRGDVRGGRFVGGLAGEQFALPEAVELLRRVRREGVDRSDGQVDSVDPANYESVLEPRRESEHHGATGRESNGLTTEGAETAQRSAELV